MFLGLVHVYTLNAMKIELHLLLLRLDLLAIYDGIDTRQVRE